MKTLGLSVAEGMKRARAMSEAKMKGTCERPIIKKYLLTVTTNIYVTAGS